MKLEDLPSDVLSLIFRGPTSWTAIELWKSGSRLLQAKMKNRGVEEVDMEAHRRFSRHVALPACLLEFQLRQLKIRLQNTPFAPQHLQSFIKKLNRSLRSLNLSGPGMLEAIFPLTLSDGRHFPMEQWRPQYVRIATSETDISALPDWSLIFPELETLTVGTPGAGSTTSPVLGDSIFACLPRSLTHLNIQESKKHGTFDSFEHLPPECRYLSLPQDALSPAALRLLPSNITHVGNSLTLEALMVLAADPSILPNLMAFPPIPPFEESTLFNHLISLGRRLPDSFKAVSLSSLPSSQIEVLPRGLVSLIINYSREGPCLNGKLLKSLPQTLRRLAVSDVDWSALDGETSWPSKLEHLCIETDAKFRAEYIYRFPRGLTSLSLNERGHRDTDTRGPADFKIDSLLALGRSALEGTENEVWRNMKAELLKKVETATGRFWKAQVTNYIAAVEKGALFGLPLGLIEFTIGPCIAIERMDFILPPQVVHFSMTLKRLGQTLSFWNLLPPSVFSISIDNPPWVPSYEFQDWEICKLSDPSACSFYHSNVSSLSIRESNKFHLPDHFFRCLPRNLRVLDVAIPAFLRAEKVGNLPTSLETLFLTAQVKEPVQIWLPKLPRSLKNLFTAANGVEGADLAFLPPNLERLETQLSKVTIDHLLTLPTSMRTFDIRFTDESPSKEHLTEEQLFVLAPLCSRIGLLRSLNKDQVVAKINEERSAWLRPRAMES